MQLNPETARRLLAACPHVPIRVDPAGARQLGRQPHFGHARLVSVDGETARILPYNHGGREEEVALQHCCLNISELMAVATRHRLTLNLKTLLAEQEETTSDVATYYVADTVSTRFWCGEGRFSPNYEDAKTFRFIADARRCRTQLQHTNKAGKYIAGTLQEVTERMTAPVPEVVQVRDAPALDSPLLQLPVLLDRKQKAAARVREIEAQLNAAKAELDEANSALLACKRTADGLFSPLLTLTAADAVLASQVS